MYWLGGLMNHLQGVHWDPDLQAVKWHSACMQTTESDPAPWLKTSHREVTEKEEAQRRLEHMVSQCHVTQTLPTYPSILLSSLLLLAPLATDQCWTAHLHPAYPTTPTVVLTGGAAFSVENGRSQFCS